MVLRQSTYSVGLLHEEDKGQLGIRSIIRYSHFNGPTELENDWLITIVIYKFIKEICE